MPEVGERASLRFPTGLAPRDREFGKIPSLLSCPGTLHRLPPEWRSPGLSWNSSPCLHARPRNVAYFFKPLTRENQFQNFDNYFPLKYYSIAPLLKSLKGQWPLLVEAAAVGKLGEEAGRGVGEARLADLAWCPPCWLWEEA